MTWSPYANEDEYRRAVLRARRMSPAEKFLAGIRLFDEECERLWVNLRRLHPGDDAAAIEERFRRYWETIRRLEENGIDPPYRIQIELGMVPSPAPDAPPC